MIRAALAALALLLPLLPAPALAQALNLEWLWRLMSRPGHLWKRYTLDMRWFLAAIWADLRSDQA